MISHKSVYYLLFTITVLLNVIVNIDAEYFMFDFKLNNFYVFIHEVDLRMHPDMDYDRPQKNYIIPEVIKNFLLYFQKSIADQNLYEIQNAYENG